MKDSNDKSDLFREMAIVDHVAGNQSEAARRSFEDAMEQDASLREAVVAEQRLRASMQEVGQIEPVSMSNFDALLTKVDEHERSAANESSRANDNAQIAYDQMAESITESAIQSSGVVVSTSPTWWTRGYSIAASIAVMAMMFGGFYSSMLAPDFDTLSDGAASAEINFVELADEGRLAKMVFSENIEQSDVVEVLNAYNLETFDSGAPLKTLYVMADKAISKQDLQDMRADSRIRQIDIFTINREG